MIHIKIVTHLLKCYFKHIFINIILRCFKNARHAVLNHHYTYSYSRIESPNRTHPKVYTGHLIVANICVRTRSA